MSEVNHPTANIIQAGVPKLAELKNHVIICGLFNAGYRILEQLIAAKIQTIVIDNHPDARFIEMARNQGITILKRDSRSEFTLQEARVTQAAAIIAVSDNDLHNLETILTACELAPNIRAVASFYNQQIGEQLIKSLPNARALSIAQLAAGTFITASLPSQVLHLFELAGQEMAVVVDRVGRNGPLQELYGLVTPIMRQGGLLNSYAAEKGEIPQPAQNGKRQMQECPPANTALLEGDLVTLVGRVLELIDLKEVSLDAQQVAAARSGKKAKPAKKSDRLPLVKLFRGLLGNLDRPLRRTLIASTLLILFGIVVFFLKGPNSDPIDALYNTMITIGSNYTPVSSDSWLFKLFAVMLIIVGTALLGVIYGYITNYIVTARLADALGKQKATNMKNHVVLVGLGQTGYLVLKGLVARGEQVAILEIDAHNRFIALARNMGVPVILGDARVAESLDLVNIAKARCITIMSNDDLANLETALNARGRNPNIRVVLRLFDRNLAERTEKTFNIQIARSASALAAPYFIAAALDFEVVTSFYVERTPFFVAKLTVKPASILSTLHVREVYTRAGVLVLAHQHAPAIVSQQPIKGITSPVVTQFPVNSLIPVFHPRPDQPLAAGDVIYFVGPYERITSAYRLNS